MKTKVASLLYTDNSSRPYLLGLWLNWYCTVTAFSSAGVWVKQSRACKNRSPRSEWGRGGPTLFLCLSSPSLFSFVSFHIKYRERGGGRGQLQARLCFTNTPSEEKAVTVRYSLDKSPSSIIWYSYFVQLQLCFTQTPAEEKAVTVRYSLDKHYLIQGDQPYANATI